jgi:Flp pilus assembly protein TadG
MVVSPKQAKVSERRRRQRSGNMILETVFTIIPTFALIFAFVDFGLLMFRWCTLQNAVREGCRYAITFQTDGTNGQDASIEEVVQQYAMGIVTNSTNACNGSGSNQTGICVNYFAPNDLNTPITTGGNVPGNVVEVSIKKVSWSWIAPLNSNYALRSTSPISLSVYSSDILGGYPAGKNSVTR